MQLIKKQIFKIFLERLFLCCLWLKSEYFQEEALLTCPTAPGILISFLYFLQSEKILGGVLDPLIHHWSLTVLISLFPGPTHSPLQDMKYKILMLSDVDKLNLLYDSDSLHKKNCLLGNKNNKLKPGCWLQAGYWLRKLLCQDICWLNSFQFLSEKLKH